jgi:predicted enzyme related to lactoylglutathione lyase
MDTIDATQTTSSTGTTTAIGQNYPIVHVEFSTKNAAESARFYSDLFGWKTSHMADWDYWTFQNEAERGGGFNNVGTSSSGLETKPGDVIVYVASPDLDATLARALELGATVVVPRVDMLGMGSYAVFSDPTGNKVGIWMNAAQ